MFTKKIVQELPSKPTTDQLIEIVDKASAELLRIEKDIQSLLTSTR